MKRIKINIWQVSSSRDIPLIFKNYINFKRLYANKINFYHFSLK